jgi:hypothetical protein
MLTFPRETISNSPSFDGGNNHLWSIAVGDVDGKAINELLPYFPNNSGNEIIVTQSTRDLPVAANKLSVLRYRSGTPIAKPLPPSANLYPFDTIATQSMKGWVAAVNDLDGADDGKDEIVVVDSSNLKILRMRDYNDIKFKLGTPFEEVAVYDFINKIYSVEIADLEGDGLNDIIVTTSDSTYVIGRIMTHAINVIAPVVSNGVVTDYCAGDTVKINWVNIFKSREAVNIKFIEYKNGIPADTAIIFESNYPNAGDTVSYNYIINNLILGKEGFFIVENVNDPKRIYDSTSLLRFNIPSITVNQLKENSFYSGNSLNIEGQSFCTDSISIFFNYRDSSWSLLRTESVKIDGSFSIPVDLPCANFFECLRKDLDSTIFIHAVAIKSGILDTAKAVQIKLMPKSFPLHFDSCPTPCRTRTFTWDLSKIVFPCDTVSVSVSFDCGLTFGNISRIPVAQENFIWNVPLAATDCMYVRFCCEGSCIRIDTLIPDVKLKYISIVSPNPFRPGSEQVEFVYKVPIETNVSIRIYDENNRLVAEPAVSQPRVPGTAYCDRWSGKIWDGSYAANGMYYLSLELSNGAKEVYPVFVKK